MKKFLLLFVLVLTVCGTAKAQSVGDCFTSGNLRYKITSLSPNTVEVTTASTLTGKYYPMTAGTTSVTIPGNVSNNGNGSYAVTKIAGGANFTTAAFYNSKIETITFQPNSQVTEIGDFAFYKSSTTRITMPASLATIGKSAFAGCAALQTVNLQEGLTTIGQSAFNGCKTLQTITIPASVSSIGQSAFSGCAALAEVTVKWTDAASIPTPGTGAFGSIAEGAVLYIPVGTRELYEAKDWDQLFTIKVSYPYIDGDGKSRAAVAEEIIPAADPVTLGAEGTTSWYVVTGADVTLSKGAVCQGDVHLILADGAKLTATGEKYQAGIRVSGTGNSLAVYGQAEQTGQLFATGGKAAAGIGGDDSGPGSNITINGGIVTAEGMDGGAGIGGGYSGSGSNITINDGEVTAIGRVFGGAGIGGGYSADGSNITINGGNVTATGGIDADGIGGGDSGSSSTILVDANTSIVKADNTDPATTQIPNTGADLAESLAGNRYVTVTNKIPVIYGENITVSPAFPSGGKVKLGTQVTFKAADLSKEDNEFLGFYQERTFATPITTGVSGLTYTTTITETSISVYAKYQYNPSVSASYTYPVYNSTGNPKAGIKEWETSTVQATMITTSATNVPETLGTSGTTSWYVVTGANVQLPHGAVCQGDVRLILADGAKLTATGDEKHAGIQVSGTSNSLTIYGQTAQSGQLIANGDAYGAGIGGGRNDSGSDITINGGTVTASGGKSGAGIGGGLNGSGSYITINGGVVTATGGNAASGIGGGDYGSSSYITINGGTVSANGGNGTSGIGGGIYGSSSDISVTTDLVLRADGSNPPATVIANDGRDLASALTGKQYATIASAPVYTTVSTTYIDEQGASHDINAYKITSCSEPVVWGSTGQTTWFVVSSMGVRLPQGAICSGNVNLILADGAKLTATGGENQAGIRVSGTGNSLTIYVQAKQSGQLVAIGGNEGAGIGGGRMGYGSNITINGGTVTANGGNHAAGIGGGQKGSGSYITINGGMVTAKGGGFGAGIGGGNEDFGSNITINGGTVTANGGNYAAGIGGGCWGSGSGITITGGTVTASGGKNGAGIGGGDNTNGAYDGDGTYITITGGTVTANGDNYAAGIGGGNRGEGSNITISGGTVMANSGINCIGGGYDSKSSKIYVAATHIVKVDVTENPTLIVAPNHTITTDIAAYFIARAHAIVEPRIVPYIDENGKTQTTIAIEANSSTSSVTWGEAGKTTWYVVTGADVQLSAGAICQGDVRLILADGAKLTAAGEENQAGIQVSGTGNSLTIYGQTAQSGELKATGGLSAAGIGGGYQGGGNDITIYGGNVTANGGLNAAGIGSGAEGADAVRITVAANLQVKADGNNPPATVIENTGSDLAGSLAGKRYVTVKDAFFNLTANQDPDHKTHYYSTFYSSTKAYALPEGVTAYTGVADGSVLTLTPTANGIIPAGEAVILRLTTTDNTAMTQKIQLTATTTTATKSTDNMLQGSDVAMTLPDNSYALSLGQKGVGFYDFSNVELPAHKAYLTYASGSSISLRFSFGDATDIDDVETEAPAKAYNLQGQQVDENYKGIVIKNGKKVLNN